MITVITKAYPCNVYLLYSKTGVYMGIPVFLSFAPKHRLWVLLTACNYKSYVKREMRISIKYFSIVLALLKKCINGRQLYQQDWLSHLRCLLCTLCDNHLSDAKDF